VLLTRFKSFLFDLRLKSIIGLTLLIAPDIKVKFTLPCITHPDNIVVRSVKVFYGAGNHKKKYCKLCYRPSNNGEEFNRFTVNACTTPIGTLHGTEVTTVEGLGSTQTCLHPVQVNIAKKENPHKFDFLAKYKKL